MKILRLLLPGLGILLLGYLVGTLGLGDIGENLAVMKWAFPVVLLLASGWHVTNSIAWSFAFPTGAFRPGLLTLIRAKLAGEAVNQLTPLANLGGEPLKAFLLRQHSPTSRGLASVVINKTGQVFTGLAFTTIGLLLVVLRWELPQALPAPIQGGLFVLISTAAVLLWALVRKQRHMFTSLLNFLKRFGLHLEALESRMAKAGSIDENIARFYRESKGRFCLVMLFHAMGWMLGALETYVILRALGATIAFDVAFLITALTLLINSLFFFMPSNIGVLEGGQVFLFMTLGLDPAMGLSLGITKRMRKIFWIALGWLFLAQLSRSIGLNREDGNELRQSGILSGSESS